MTPRHQDTTRRPKVHYTYVGDDPPATAISEKTELSEKAGDHGEGAKDTTWMLLKTAVPQIIHFYRVFHRKPSILGYPYIWKHPYIVLH